MSDDGFELAVDTLEVFGEPEAAEKEDKPEPSDQKDEKQDEPKEELKVVTAKTSGDASELNTDLLDKKKDPESCKIFRLDPAGEFGACKYCGRQRKEHGEKKQNKAAQILNQHRIRNSTAQDDVDMRVGDGPCGGFKIDLTAGEFAVCKICGFKRTDHVEKGMNKAEEALLKLKNKNKKAYNGRTSADGPCTNYKVDTQAAEFGACFYCGFKKESHVVKKENAASRMVRELREKNEAKHKMEDLAAEGVLPEDSEVEKKEDTEIKVLETEEIKAEVPAVEKKKKTRGFCVCS